jgi:hypothetical protein
MAKVKKETYSCSKKSKEESQGRKAKEIYVGIHEW